VTAFGAESASSAGDTQTFIDAISATSNGGDIVVSPSRYQVDADEIVLGRAQRPIGSSRENFGNNRGSTIDINGPGEYGIQSGESREPTAVWKFTGSS